MDHGGIRTCESLGSLAKFELNKEDKQLEIHYYFEKDLFKKATVKLICDKSMKNGQLECLSDCITFHPVLQYTSGHVCLRDTQPTVKPPNRTNGGWLSTGSIILIVFGVLVFLYLSIGIIRGIFRGHSGCDRLPHSDFWLELPLLVRDGCRLAFTCKKPRPYYDGNRRKRRRRRKSRGEIYQPVSYDNTVEEVHL